MNDYKKERHNFLIKVKIEDLKKDLDILQLKLKDISESLIKIENSYKIIKRKD